MVNEFHYSMPEALDSAFTDIQNAAYRGELVARIWKKDPSVWTDSGEENWLGWLDIAQKERRELEKYESFSSEVRDAGFENMVLLGMGGSSLCPEVFALTFGKTNFHILDSTVPAQIRALESRIDIAKTLFIVASKSGSTLEPNTFKQYFFKRVCETVGEENAGSHFVAITDPGSKLEAAAKQDGYRAIFYGDSKVGGRFSALSVFGLIPASAMGINIEQFLNSSIEMNEECRENAADRNPGASLGLFLGLCHRQGKDKLTIFTSPEISDVGAWMEQLVAESTGKEDYSIIPVDRESMLDASEYGSDRVFAFMSLKDDESFERFKFDLSDEGHPYAAISLENTMSIGQEFFRWEFATAVAGSVMEINPFDQPDVEAAKVEAKKITESYEENGELPAEDPFHVAEGFKFHGDKELAGRVSQLDKKDPADVLLEHLSRIRTHDYCALLAYVEMDNETESLLQEMRDQILRKYNVATCLGFGPRFLHSTGQAYKGGANNGVFLQITSDDAEDLRVPGQEYTFGVVKAAQSRGDFQVLKDRGRRALRIHIGSDVIAGLKDLSEILKAI